MFGKRLMLLMLANRFLIILGGGKASDPNESVLYK